MIGTTTVSGGTTPTQFTASGSTGAYKQFFSVNTTYTVYDGSGASTVSGPVVIGANKAALTVSGASAVADTTAGGNSITTTGKSAVFAAANDTVSAGGAASTVFGASAGVTHFAVSGNNSSITGGAGGFVGAVSASNSTLVGGTSVSIISVSGSNNLAVAGAAGITGIDLSQSTGPNTVATNPLGNSGQLVAFLGGGPDTVLGGGGQSTIKAGSGHDAFIFVNGHAGGSETILGFSASDNFGFAGYGYSGTNLPTETVGALGDVISLSDGTRITLVGFDHKLF